MISKSVKMMLLVVVGSLICLWYDSANAAKYEYDALNRLTRVVYDNGTAISYTYDKVGNRTQRVSTLLADTSIDGKVDFKDFAILASRWLEQDCISSDWCGGSDIDWSGSVDFDDLAILAQQWLESVP
jgi:YD repeat-containing protein